MEENQMTRQQAIRAQCIFCCNGSMAEVRKCHIVKCPLWRYRMGYESKDAVGDRLTRQEAIKAKCLDCVCGIRSEIRNCPFTNCALHKYRP